MLIFKVGMILDLWCVVVIVRNAGLVVLIEATVKWCVGLHITACFDEHNVLERHLQTP